MNYKKHTTKDLKETHMPKKTYDELPANYPVCQHAECPLASTCLHQMAYATLITSRDFLHLINPNRCTKDDTCPHYRCSTPITYARGFTNFQKHMYPQQYHEFMRLCISHFSRNPYFERRRGDYPLPPSEQAIILDAAKQAGVTADLTFDTYEDRLNWYD